MPGLLVVGRADGACVVNGRRFPAQGFPSILGMGTDRDSACPTSVESPSLRLGVIAPSPGAGLKRDPVVVVGDRSQPAPGASPGCPGAGLEPLSATAAHTDCPGAGQVRTVVNPSRGADEHPDSHGSALAAASNRSQHGEKATVHPLPAGSALTSPGGQASNSGLLHCPQGDKSSDSNLGQACTDVGSFRTGGLSEAITDNGSFRSSDVSESALGGVERKPLGWGAARRESIGTGLKQPVDVAPLTTASTGAPLFAALPIGSAA
ncbi:hypothetical protein [Kibdelosporangium philippinense]|uniref:hypothetical protein n=1 Tax=Kibdelosporangium philippinense TaxID=211113 RepID=UPI0036160A80